MSVLAHKQVVSQASYWTAIRLPTQAVSLKQTSTCLLVCADYEELQSV